MRVSSSGSSRIQNNEVSSARQTSRAHSTALTSEKFETVNTTSVATSHGTQTQISTQGKEFSRAKEVASQAPDVREQKVAELRSKIASGQYQTEAGAIADRMLNYYLEMLEIG